MNIEDLKKFVQEMKVLRETLTSIAISIDTAQSYLETPSKKIKDFYTINDEPIDNNELNSVKEELIFKRDRIKNVIIPEIDAQVGMANQNITRLEDEERQRAEQARIEEENRQRAAAELAAANSQQSSYVSQPQPQTTPIAPSAPQSQPQTTVASQTPVSQQPSQSSQDNPKPKPKPKPANGANYIN